MQKSKIMFLVGVLLISGSLFAMDGGQTSLMGSYIKLGNQFRTVGSRAVYKPHKPAQCNWVQADVYRDGTEVYHLKDNSVVQYDSSGSPVFMTLEAYRRLQGNSPVQQ